MTRLDTIVRHQVHNLRMACIVAAQDTARASLLQQYARGTGRVRDFKHLAGVARHFTNPAHNSIRRDNRHLRRNTIIRAFIYIENLCMVRAAGPQHLRRYGCIYIVLLKGQQLLKAFALARILGKCRLLKLQPLVLCQ